MNRTILAVLTAVLAMPGLVAAGQGPRRISRSVLADKIRGGWAGQMIGVSYGAPTEFKANGRIGDWDLKWKPEMIENTIHQDDLYVEMTFAKVMDEIGLKASTRDYGAAFRDSKYHLWHANAGARRALNQGIEAPWSGHPKYNIHANDIDFQIEADFIGLMCPGLPREANKYCDRVGRVMNYGDGLYGGMFVCGMYVAAYFEDDPRKVVEAGLSCIPPKSDYARLISDLLAWSRQYPNDWRKVWQLVEDKWNRNDPCPDGALAAFNIDAKLNGAYIAFGLLFGGGDFLKTMEISARCGQDSDCNPSSAAGVLGVMLGYSRIPEEFKAGIAKLPDTQFDFTDYSFNDIVKSTEARALEIIQDAGGRVTDAEAVVPFQVAKAPRLEQWTPGIPDSKLAADNPAWTWSGQWIKGARGGMTSAVGGSQVTLKFSGVGVALIGALTQQGGRADVFLDSKRKGVADAYIVERTHDNCLWHISNLKPGEHTLRLITRDDADVRSNGRNIVLDHAVIYRGRQ